MFRHGSCIAQTERRFTSCSRCCQFQLRTLPLRVVHTTRRWCWSVPLRILVNVDTPQTCLDVCAHTVERQVTVSGKARSRMPGPPNSNWPYAVLVLEDNARFAVPSNANRWLQIAALTFEIPRIYFSSANTTETLFVQEKWTRTSDFSLQAGKKNLLKADCCLPNSPWRYIRGRKELQSCAVTSRWDFLPSNSLRPVNVKGMKSLEVSSSLLHATYGKQLWIAKH